MKYGLPKLAKSGEDVGFKTVSNAVYCADGRTAEDHFTELHNMKPVNIDVSNIRLGIMGDGIIFGTGLNDPSTESFISLLGNHFTTCINYAKSGILLTYKTSTNGTTHPSPICIEYESMANTLDVILIFLTTNDWYYSVPKGAITDTVNTTYYGALNNLIIGLQNKYPNGNIFFITPTPRVDLTDENGNVLKSSDDKNSVGLTLRDYLDVVRETCEYHTVPVIDLFKNINMNIVHNKNHKLA